MKDNNPFIQRFDALLAEGFAVDGDGLATKIRKVRNELPVDLLDFLQNLAQSNEVTEECGADDLEFAFQCGQAYERLDNLVQSRLTANIVFHAPDGTPPLELEKSDLDSLARFVHMRDRLLRTVADYTLKFLLVSVILLVLGLSLGLI